MSFVCTVRDEASQDDRIPLCDAYSLMTRVGYTSDGGIDDWIKVGLADCPGVDLEFYFCLIRVDREPMTETPIFEALQVAALIEATDRFKIRRLLMALSEQLIRSIMPERFAMTTYDAYLPEAAMTKFV